MHTHNSLTIGLFDRAVEQIGNLGMDPAAAHVSVLSHAHVIAVPGVPEEEDLFAESGAEQVLG